MSYFGSVHHSRGSVVKNLSHGSRRECVVRTVHMEADQEAEAGSRL